MALRHETDWQPQRTLADCMRYMLNNKIATDVCFEVGSSNRETVHIHAHKYMLIARSPVFAAMFSSGMSECSDPVAKVRIEDIDGDIFKELLNYMYCERASMSPESAIHLMYAAKKYMLPKLVTDCCICILTELDVRNVIRFLDYSMRLDEEQLKTGCIRLIALHATEVLGGTDILSASRLVMEAVLDAQTIAVRESRIYETAVKWARHQLRSAERGDHQTDLQIRETLGGLLYKIRFPVMRASEFAEISAGSDVLTLEEKESIYYFLVTGKMDRELKFPIQERIFVDGWMDWTCSGLNYGLSHRWHSAPSVEVTDFRQIRNLMHDDSGLNRGYVARRFDVDVETSQPTNSVFKNLFRSFFGDLQMLKIYSGDQGFVLLFLVVMMSAVMTAVFIIYNTK